jgi:uncharacterized protein YgbK (DUF1537 family)
VIYIIADDLTGANDTGVQFAKHGYTTRVVIASETISPNLSDFGNLAKDTEVLVIDTETREIEAITARERVRLVLENLNPTDKDIVYKKIDSTLRGNIGVELTECLHILKRDICIFTPSFPQNRRITVGGYLIVGDQPLGLSEYYSGNLKPAEASFIPALLQQDTDVPIARIDLGDIITAQDAILRKIRDLSLCEYKILVADAINTEELQHLLISSFEFEGSVLYCGSAGLANALAEVYQGKKHSNSNASLRSESETNLVLHKNQESVLIVNGSQRTIVQRQIEYLKNKIDVFEVNIDVEQIVVNREILVEHYVTSVTRSLQQGRHIVIHPNPFSPNKQKLQDTVLKEGQCTRKLELTIREFLGELTAKIIDKISVKNIILTGGDTAIGVCSALQMYNLSIVDELLPGIPLSVGQVKNGRFLNIVTKAGGFGEEDALYLLLSKLI